MRFPSKQALIAAFIILTFAAGCSRHAKKDDAMSGAASESQKSTVIVQDEKTVTESALYGQGSQDGRVTSSDITSSETAQKHSGAPFVPLTAGGDELTKKAEDKGYLYAIYFDYDQYSLRDQDKAQMETNARWLKVNTEVNVTIEGNADERGESEYNMALGEKRAQSVKKFLETMGVSEKRLSTVSYGEEKPADPGHTEDAWAKNRRAEFKIAR